MPIPKKKEPSVRMTAKERIYTTLQLWIVDGILQPNERLNDAELADYFSVSRTPVREALQMLYDKNLVQIIPSSGTFVAPINAEELRHIYELLIQLQLFTLQLCHNRISDSDFQHLTELNEAFHRCGQSGNTADTVNADSAFHLYFCKISGNHYLTQFSEELSIHIRRSERLYFCQPSTLEISYQNHKRIISSLRQGRLEEAQAEMKANWELSVENISR